MIHLSTCLTILSVAEQGLKLFDWFSGARFGDNADQALAARRRDDPNLIKVSDRIYVDNSLQEVRSGQSTSSLSDIREIRELVEPIADATNGNVLTSRISQTPPRLRAAFEDDPWSVLDNVRPMTRALHDPRPDWVPIAFYENGTEYLGWQKRGALPQLFDCEFTPADSRPPEPIEPAAYVQSGGLPVPEAVWSPTAIMEALSQAFWPVMSSAGLYFSPDIPEHKLKNALSLIPMPRDEKVIALLDATLFGSAKKAMLFCTKGIHFRNGEGTQPIQASIAYLDFCGHEIKAFNACHVEFGPCHIFDTSGSTLLNDQMIVALMAFQAELRAALA